MKTGNEKNKGGKKNGGFLDGVDPHDQVGVRDALMGLFTKKGINVVQVGAPGFEMSLHTVGDDPHAPPAPSGNREVDNLLKKIHGLTKPSNTDKEIAPLPKKNDKRKKGGIRFYWQYGEDNGDGEYYIITPKEYFDREGGISDDHFDEEDIPDGFDNLMESTFSFVGTRQEAEALLRANPLFEEKEMV